VNSNAHIVLELRVLRSDGFKQADCSTYSCGKLFFESEQAASTTAAGCSFLQFFLCAWVIA
jgi:hypothetical protein